MDATPDWPTRDLLAHRVASTPDATAVVDAQSGDAWTYGELAELVAAAAADLGAHLADAEGDGGQARQTGPDRRSCRDRRPRVAIHARTTPRFVEALFAAWRCGAQAAPIDGSLPADDLAQRLSWLDPDLVVADGDDGPIAGAVDAPTLSLADVDLDVASVPDADRQAHDRSAGEWEPDETALVLFTSGTTGRPKGVRLTHRNLVASAVGSALRLGLDPAERWLDCLPTNHMGGLAPIVRSTLYGTTVVLQPGFDRARTAEAIADRGVTAASFVPTQVRRLLDDGWAPPDALRVVLLGGAPAAPALIEDCEAAGVPVCPTYGTTETASQVATAAPGEAFAHPESVGSPLVVADVTVVDPEDGTPVDAGDVGEVVVDGPIVTPGYLDEAATEAAFGEYGLHTGDLATRDASGRLRVRGRLDDAVQTGGETVHPWRVRDALVDHPDVAEAAIVGVPDAEWGERVAALVVPVDGSSVDRSDLLGHCRDALAAYEVPKTLRIARSLPRTDSGSVDRGAVRDELAAS